MRAWSGRLALVALLGAWAGAWAGGCAPAEGPGPDAGPAAAAAPAPGPEHPEPPQSPEHPGDASLPATLLLEFRAAADDRPLPGIPFEVWWSREQEPARTAGRSAQDGTQDIQLPHGTRILEVHVQPTALTAPRRVEVGELLRGGQTSTLELRLDRAAMVSGTVVDELGQPLGGGRVAAFHLPLAGLDREAEPAPAAWAQCEEDGSFRLGGFPAGPFVIEAVLEGRACVRRASGTLEVGQQLSGFELVTEPARRVLGQAHGADGAGIAGVSVVAGRVGAYTHAKEGPVAGSHYFPGRPLHAQSDADGLFVLPAVPETEEWRLDAWHPRHLPAEARILPGEIDVFVEMSPAAAVAGTLTGADGARLPFASVTLFRQQGPLRSGADGVGDFLFGALPPEEGNWLLAAAPRHAPTLLGPLHVREGLPRQDLQLSAGQPLAGQVRGADGAPLGEAQIRLIEPVPEPGFPPEWTPLRFLGRDVARTAEDGSFRWSHLPVGSYALEVTLPDGGTHRFEDCAAGADALALRVPAEAPQR